MALISPSHDRAFTPSIVVISRAFSTGINVGFLLTSLRKSFAVFIISNVSALLSEHGCEQDLDGP